MGLSEGTVASALHTARQALRLQLGEEVNVDPLEQLRVALTSRPLAEADPAAAQRRGEALLRRRRRVTAGVAALVLVAVATPIALVASRDQQEGVLLDEPTPTVQPPGEPSTAPTTPPDMRPTRTPTPTPSDSPGSTATATPAPGTGTPQPEPTPSTTSGPPHPETATPAPSRPVAPTPWPHQPTEPAPPTPTFAPSSARPAPTGESPVPADPDDRRYICDPGPEFPAAALEGPADAEEREGPQYDGLRDTLARFQRLPQTGWRVLGTSELRWSFGHEDVSAEGRFRSLHLQNQVVSWEYTNDGECRPAIFVQGHESATWEYSKPLDADSQLVEAGVTGHSCSGGRELGDRVEAPRIDYRPDAVVITFVAEPLPPGTYTCPGNPPTLVAVTLDEPLGDRVLLDGGLLPARNARTMPF